VLFIVGNTATGDRTVVLTPDWKALKLDPAKLSVFDPESGEKIALSRGGFPVSVAARGLRLVLAGLPKSYAPKNTVVGGSLPKPARVIEGVSDRFDGKALDAAWVPTLHEGNAGVYMLEGRLCIQGAMYGYAHVRRELPADAASVQCMIVRAPSGGNDDSGGSLFLWWANGEYVQATPGSNAGKFLAVASGAGRGAGGTVSKDSAFGWYPYSFNWVKIVLKPETIEFHGSADGAAWTKYWEAKRGTQFAGPPQFAILGNGHPGKNPLLANVVAAHFAPTGAMTRTFYSDFIVGRD